MRPQPRTTSRRISPNTVHKSMTSCSAPRWCLTRSRLPDPNEPKPCIAKVGEIKKTIANLRTNTRVRFGASRVQRRIDLSLPPYHLRRHGLLSGAHGVRSVEKPQLGAPDAHCLRG